MKNIFSIGILLFLTGAFFSSCKPDGNLVTPKQERTEYSYISGTIKLPDGSPVEGVSFNNGSSTVYSDINGKYIIDNIAVGTEIVLEPKKPFYSFDPLQKVRVVNGGVNNIDFTATRTDGMTIKTIREGDLTFYTIDNFETTIVKIPFISDYIYHTKLEPIYFAKIADSADYRVVVNASYFDTDGKQMRYINAGYLKVKNQVLSPVKPNDLQIMKLLAYNTNENRMRFYELSELDKTGDYDLVVQTGPSIIKNNVVDNSSIDSSINGKRQAYRTSLATVNGNEFYIIVTAGTRGGILLKNLGQMLLDSGIFYKGELNVIGLDGGPSTAIYIKNHPELSYNITGVHPTAICVK